MKFIVSPLTMKDVDTTAIIDSGAQINCIDSCVPDDKILLQYEVVISFFSIVSLPPLSFDSPFTFTISIMFLNNTFHYTVW